MTKCPNKKKSVLVVHSNKLSFSLYFINGIGKNLILVSLVSEIYEAICVIMKNSRVYTISKNPYINTLQVIAVLLK